MLRFITNFIGSMITSYIMMYLAYRIANIKVEYKNIRFWVMIILYALYLTLSLLCINESWFIFRIFMNYVFLILCFKITTKKSLLLVSLYCFSSILIVFISEFLCTCILVYLLKLIIIH